MKIAIDARSLTNQHRMRGIGAYTRNLLEGLAEIDPDNQYLLISNDNLKVPLPPQSQIKQIRRRTHPSLDYLWGHRLEIDGVDVYLQPDLNFGFPQGNFRRVGVVYDFIEEDYRIKSRGLKGWLAGRLRRAIYRQRLQAMQASDAIITISDYTKIELDTRFPALAARSQAIPLGVKPVVPQKPKFPIEAPYLIYVGGGDQRKNVAALIEAFNQIRQSGTQIKLCLVGSDFTNQAIKEQLPLRNAIEHSPFLSDITRPGYLPDPEVAWLYHHAAVLVFPSLAEGFGLPVLEAMEAGCPVVCFKNSSLPEVVGDAALLVESADQLPISIEELLSNAGLREKLIEKGKVRAAQFSWQKTAEATLKVLKGSSK
jgi:glycosyltransferase involved in cell wall biosynthesis